MSNNHRYVADPLKLFDDDCDDIDDDTFLRGSPYYQNSSTTTTNENLNQMQDVKLKILESQKRTIESAQRSTRLLHDSEQVGISTAEELARQREQLENANNRLDDIGSNLRQTQRNINGIKSIFGGLKNFINSRGSTAPPTTTTTTSSSSQSNNQDRQQLPLPEDKSLKSPVVDIGKKNLYENHPSTILKVNDEQSYAPQTNSSFNEQLDKNLDEMAGSLSRLRDLSLDLNREIDSQNDLLDVITNKTETVDMNIGRQNKEMNKLLGKK